jgi:hypothetical protein
MQGVKGSCHEAAMSHVIDGSARKLGFIGASYPSLQRKKLLQIRLHCHMMVADQPATNCH